MKENGFKKQLDLLTDISEAISENTELYKYIKQVNEMMYSDGQNKLYEEKYKAIVENRDLKSENRVFLSVIVRSQGNRPQGLREALLCLRAQENQNFEIILIAHKAKEDGKKCIHEILDEQPEGFRSKIRYLEIDNGTRTTPINVGFANAYGQYIAIFDDDDLLFDNWVEEFYEAAKENNGKILHAFSLAQKWKRITTNTGEHGYMAMEAPASQFCMKFDFLSQLVVNKCPLMSLAFPAYLFQKMGIIFNEELNVTEDWEYFMRVVTITGIADIEKATSIYRLWFNEENSSTLHEQSTWLDTYLKIQGMMDHRATLLPSGYTKYVISLIQRCNEDDLKMATGYPKLQGILYYGEDRNFSDERMIIANNSVYSPSIDMEFPVPAVNGNTQYFRFDPCEYGGFILRDIKILMVTGEGGLIEARAEECIHNGIAYEGGIYYMHYDPQIIWYYPGKEKIVSVKIKAETCMEIPESLIMSAIERESIEGKIKRKCKNFAKKIIRR